MLLVGPLTRNAQLMTLQVAAWIESRDALILSILISVDRMQAMGNVHGSSTSAGTLGVLMRLIL